MSTTIAGSALAGPAHEWTGSVESLRALADEHGIQPWSGSPLLGIEALRTRSHSPPDDGLSAALLRVAQPQVTLDISHLPPAGTARAQCCGRAGSDWYACHWVDGEAHHVAWPATPAWLARLLLATVDPGRDSAPVGLRLQCDRAGYEAFAALVDLLHQESLVSLLEGRPARNLVLDGTDLLAAYLRPRAERDLRWMTARARRIAPTPLAPSAGALAEALAALGRAHWTRPTGRGWQVESGLRTACTILATASGWYVVSRRVRRPTSDGGIVWRREHAAVMRCLDSLWVFEFSQLAATDFRVEFGDASPGTVMSLTKRLLAPLAPAEDVDPSARPVAQAQARPESPATSRKTCRACGASVRPGVKFCTACGAQL